MSTLLRSQIECPDCHEVIASIHRHDFRTCGCGGTSIDGGRDYLRVAVAQGSRLDHVIDRSLVVESDLSKQEAAHVLNVYKSLLIMAEETGSCHTSGIANWFNYAAIARPIMNFPLGGYKLPTIRKWLRMLEVAGAVESFRDGNRTMWRPLLPWADRPEA